MYTYINAHRYASIHDVYIQILSIYRLHVCTYMRIVFTTEEFSEAAMESWPEWNLNPVPLNSVQTL